MKALNTVLKWNWSYTADTKDINNNENCAFVLPATTIDILFALSEGVLQNCRTVTLTTGSIWNVLNTFGSKAAEFMMTTCHLHAQLPVPLQEVLRLKVSLKSPPTAIDWHYVKSEQR